MAEQNPIKYSDLITPDDSIEKLIAQLEKVTEAYNGLAARVKSQAASISSSLKTISGATEQGRASTRSASQEVDRLTKAYKDLEFAQSDTAKRIADLKQIQKEQNMMNKLTAESNRAVEGSYNALSAQYRLNKMYINNLTKAERENDPAAKKLIEETRQIYEEMNKMQQATGKFSLNVGNYTQSIEQAIGVNSKWYQGLQQLAGLFQGGFKSGVQQAGTAVAGFGKQLLALLANPIVATIAAITAAFMALAKCISSSEENTNTLMRIMAPFQRVITGVVDVLQTMAGWLLKAVEGFENLAMGASRLMERLPLVGGAFKKVNDALRENVELERQRQELVKAERANTQEQATLARNVAKWRKDAEKTSDPKRRMQLLKMADNTEKRIMLNEIELARKDYEIKKRKAEQSQNDAKTNDELAQAYVRLMKAEENYYSRTTRIASKMRKLQEGGSKGGGGSKGSSSGNSDAERQAKEQERIRKDAEKKELTAIRQAEDTKVALMENDYDRERAVTILKYDREIEDLRTRLETEENLTVAARQAMNDTIVNLEQQKWDKLADINDKEMKEALDAEQKDYEARIKATDELIRKQEQEQKKKKDIYDVLGFKLDDEQKAAIDQSLQYALDSLHMFMDAYAKAAEAKRQIADAEVERAQSTLEAEIEARNNGYANEVETARKELEAAKKNQEKAIKEQQKAQQAQEAIDTATQVSSLITATANIWKVFSSVPFVGTALAVAATALMWGSFAAAKIKAHEVAGSGTEQYGEGTVELLQGGSHQSGNDIDLGRKKDGTRRRAEGGEFFAVINKRSSRRYRDLIPEVVNALNDGTFAEKYMQQGGDINVVAAGGNDARMRALSDDVHQIRQQGEVRTYTDGKGNTVTVYKNVKRITRPS